MYRTICRLFLLLGCTLTITAQDTTTYDNRSGLSHWIVSDVVQDRQGFVWLSTWNGLNRFDGYQFRQIKDQPGDGTNIQSQVIRQIVLDDNGDIICLTADGAFKLDTKSYQLMDMPVSVRNNIPHNSHPASLEDHEGNVWQVQRYGITKTSPTHHPAQLVKGTENVQARAFLRDRQNRWWLATKEDECVRLFDDDNQLLGYLGSDGRLHSEKTAFGYRVYSMTQTAGGDIWMGCKPGALLRLRVLNDGSYEIRRITAASLTCDVIYHIVEDADGRLWLATFGGGVQCLVNPAVPQPICVNFTDSNIFSNGTEKVRRILLTPTGNIVCATTNGLVIGNIHRQDIAKSTFRKLARDGQRAGSMAGNAVMDVVCMGQDRILIATENNGIDMTTEKELFGLSPTFRHFNKQNSSLTSDACLAMTVKDDGRLFVVCSDQVIDFDPDSDNVVTYSRRFWNAATHFSEERPLLLPDGSWLFGQEQGAYIATRHHLETRGYQPPLVFTELTIDGQSLNLGISTQDTIVIGTNERNFTITFAALDYTDNSGIRYRHRLDDAPWSHASSDRSLTFHSMQPGRYLLAVQSTDRYGRWIDNTRRLVIIVKPHWYETLWARLLGWLLVACIITAIVYTFFYVRQLNRQRRELLEKYMALIETGTPFSPSPVTHHPSPVKEEPSLPSELSEDDRKFLSRVMKYIEENLSDSNANIDDMAAASATSRSSLNRKLRSLMGITAAQLLIDARMRKARQLLQSGGLDEKPNITDIAYRCGYSDARYFSRCFKQKYGITPSEASSTFTIICIMGLMTVGVGSASAQTDYVLEKLWHNPTADYRMKTWWFFGYERTTDEGITADVEALRDAGFGGVVYYDQNHAKDPVANGAEDAFSPSWWHHLHFAAEEAQRVGMSFELNISNGYCAGGRWIDAEHAMQRVASAEYKISGGRTVKMALPAISSKHGYVRNIAVLAFPTHDDGRMRHVTARYVAKGKGRNGAMQGPIPNIGDFCGYGFTPLSDVGVLQASDDSLTWRDVVTLAPMYRSQGGYFVRTNAFPATEGRFWRVKYAEGAAEGLKEWRVGSAAKLDRWEERAALHSDFAEGDETPSYSATEVIAADDIINLTDSVSGDTLHCTLPAGAWTILRLSAVLTGAKSKHGRPNLLGYECDKLSKTAARLHWNSYVQVLVDSLNSEGQRLVQGVTMDSHEGGSQNWTPLMLQEFRQRRGYDFTVWLPVLAGYVVESAERTAQVLYDYRQTISDCIRDNYFGTLQELATKNGLSFTAQAIGNALCITGDAISVKQAVEKPQGEFWTYQQQGAYDIKDCSSAAHLYGKPIASAEAMTDCEYKNTPEDLHRVANIAFSMGTQEFVVCATPHIPTATTSAPYIAGREYAINRSNPQWQQMKPVWQQAARSMVMLRHGRAAPDVLVFLGDDVPIKTITNRLPDGLDGLDWDVCTADALMNRLEVVDRRLSTPDGITYKALLIAKQAHISSQTQRQIDAFRAAGVPILYSGESIVRPLMMEKDKDHIVHTHRQTNSEDIFYIASIEDRPLCITFRLQKNPKRATLWNNRTGRYYQLKPSKECTFSLQLEPMASVFVTVER